MSRNQDNTGFTCEQCGQIVVPLTNGSYRNHCPFCLFSKHIDVLPGDRLSNCGALMKPLGIQYKSGKGYQVIHRCLRCGKRSVNRVAENTVQPDDIELVIRLSKPLNNIHPDW